MLYLRGKVMLNNFKKLNKIEIYPHIWIQNLYLLYKSLTGWISIISHWMDKYQLVDAVKILHHI